MPENQEEMPANEDSLGQDKTIASDYRPDDDSEFGKGVHYLITILREDQFEAIRRLVREEIERAQGKWGQNDG